LKGEGHEARLVVSTAGEGTDYRPICKRLGVPLRVVPEELHDSVIDLAAAAKHGDPTKIMTAVLEKTFRPYVEAMYAAGLELCASSDVVVGGSSSWPLKAASLKARVPFVTVNYMPASVPSRILPPPMFPAWRWLAGPTWALIHLMFDLGFRDGPRKFFAAKGLPPIRHVIPDVVFSDTLNLHAASPSFWPPAPDWSDIHCVCGEFFMPDEAETWVPSAAFAAYLAEGPAPVLLSLGSWEHIVGDRGRALLTDAARASGMRAIIQTKVSEREERDGDVYFLPWAPHRQLVPACSAVVHHGGAGTTHMTLRAGKPALVLPFILEQRVWARRVEAVGAGEWISFWKATPARVAAAMRRVASSEALRTGAGAMAKAMAIEDGTGLAVRRIEGLA
jgi:UDP:flavonoid glycosyltransferase YjiC (YdhE family)